MNFSKLFIQRPVATIVIMIALVIAGLSAYVNLPISELPNVDFPTLEVKATLPGADPETMAASVATPLEKTLSTVNGVDSISSISSSGSTKIIMQFALNRDINSAAQDVQSALLQVMRKLPSQMPNPPSVRKENPADAPILFIALTADNVPLIKLDDYAENYIAPNLSMADGVASVNVFGAQQYAVRVHLNPDAVKNRGLSLNEISQAIQNLNSNQATGTLQSYGFYHLIKVDGGLDNAQQFSNAVIAYKDNSPIRLKDIATVENSVANDKAETWYNNKRAIVLAIQRQPGSNTVAVVNNVLRLLPSLSQELPGGAKLKVVYNRASFIKAEINDVQLTLLFAIFLVTFVVYLFLQRVNFTVIAALSLPISVIATFAVMYLLGYSLDNLSLMALVLAVGFIIDDAIVVLENIVRHIEKGVTSLEASLAGAKEVFFTVLAMTISLAAVFIPIFFMGGIIGKLFYEFAAVVAIAIIFSAFVALTLIPVMCSRLNSGITIQTKTNNIFTKTKTLYESSLAWALERYKLVLIIAVLIILVTGVLFYLIPKGFIPAQDTGVIFGGVAAPEGITYQNFVAEQDNVKKIIKQNPNVAAVISSVGQGSDASVSTSSGRLIIKLNPSSQRKVNADKVIQQLRHALEKTAGLKIFLSNPPAIRIGGKMSNSNYQYVLQGIDWASLGKSAALLEMKLAQIPGVVDVDSDLKLNNPELKLHILRDKAAALGITPAAIEATLYAAYGQEQVSSIMRADGDYDVIMDIASNFQHDPDALNTLYLKSSSGTMVPLTNLVTITQGAGPLSINHYGQLPAVTLSFSLQPGHSLGEIVAKIQSIAKQSLPLDVSGAFVGTAQKFAQSLRTLPLLLFFTVLIIYMVLAILYESFVQPLTILTAIPFAVFGALLCLYLFNQELDLFSFIGLIMLVGITKKNGIIMVDFALDAMRTQRISAKKAILQACSIRFRPIMMTTVAAIIVAIPIALGIGAGGETRRSLGIAIVGGLIFSQLITLYITPVFFMVMARNKY